MLAPTVFDIDALEAATEETAAAADAFFADPARVQSALDRLRVVCVVEAEAAITGASGSDAEGSKAGGSGSKGIRRQTGKGKSVDAAGAAKIHKAVATVETDADLISLAVIRAYVNLLLSERLYGRLVVTLSVLVHKWRGHVVGTEMAAFLNDRAIPSLEKAVRVAETGLVRFVMMV